MPTFTAGKGFTFKVADAGGTLRDLSAYLSSVDLPRTQDKAAFVTSTGIGTTKLVTLVDGKITIAGKFDPTLLTGPHAVLASLRRKTAAGTAAPGTFQYGPAGSASGKTRVPGSALLTDYQIEGPLGAEVSFTASFQVSGAITPDTWP